eukprot:EW706115.1.p5 GENE.EW706115.1~~EW706115.1.p5  ORF type:complete len:75 (-),score=18.05 EW706115.1:81-305(-)
MDEWTNGRMDAVTQERTHSKRTHTTRSQDARDRTNDRPTDRRGRSRGRDWERCILVQIRRRSGQAGDIGAVVQR